MLHAPLVPPTKEDVRTKLAIDDVENVALVREPTPTGDEKTPRAPGGFVV